MAKAKKKPKKKDQEDGLFAWFGNLLAWEPAEREEPSEHVQEIKGIVLFGLSLWLLLSMASYWRPIDDPAASGLNWGGQVGFYFADLAFMATGAAGLVFAVLGVLWGCVLVARKHVELPSLRVLSAVVFVLAAAFLIELGFGADGAASQNGPSARLPYGPGGWLALRATPVLQQKFGEVGLWVLMTLTSVVALMLATEMAFYPALAALAEWTRARREERGESFVSAVLGWLKQLGVGLWNFVRGAALDEGLEPATAPAALPLKASRAKSTPKARKPAPVAVEDDEEEEEEGDEEEGELEEYDEDEEYEDEEEGEDEEDEEDEEEGEYDEDYDDEEEDEEDEVELKPAAKAREKIKALVPQIAKELPFDPPRPPAGDWKLPPMELLVSPDRSGAVDNESIEASARKLERALESFRVDAQVVGAQVGPTVILFELEVSQGTRMNRVTQLSQEIAATLRAQSVRIIAPIPGRSTVGIEVPNAKRRMVRISELVTAKAYDQKFAAIPLFIGVDAEGTPIVEDLAKMPHLLIAGTTGSGKSVCINTILASMLLTRSPHDVEMILIDPKMVELQMFANIPHLLLPVVTDMRQATAVLNWAIEKMEGRYELFKDAGVKNIKGYNALGEDKLRERLGDNFNEERTPRHVPYMVVVIDEFADLMMTSKKEAEQAITRLAQKSRAVGIHVILATQRPSTDVITGVIKGNLPTRIAFQVASRVDSRVILDSQGAEKLLGGGDMLYTPPSSSRVKRVQGALVEDHELQALVDFVCQEAAPSFNQELVQAATGTAQPGAGGGFESALQDELWDDAVRVILKSKRGSASLLQRALGVGYTRASRLLDMMSEAGIVSDHKGSKAREVLMTLEDWEEAHGAPAGPGASAGSGEEQ